jgi:hypothetical protein
LISFVFCGTEVWTQGLCFEPLHEIGSRGTICLGWLWTSILLISTSWVARITGMSHCAWQVMLNTFLYIYLATPLAVF